MPWKAALAARCLKHWPPTKPRKPTSCASEFPTISSRTARRLCFTTPWAFPRRKSPKESASGCGPGRSTAGARKGRRPSEADMQAQTSPSIKIDKLILARLRGFCAGVVRAIDVVERALEVCGGKVYVRHEIIHNRYVVEGLRAKGAVFVEDLAEVPAGSWLIFSAPGVGPA